MRFVMGFPDFDRSLAMFLDPEVVVLGRSLANDISVVVRAIPFLVDFEPIMPIIYFSSGMPLAESFVAKIALANGVFLFLASFII